MPTAFSVGDGGVGGRNQDPRMGSSATWELGLGSEASCQDDTLVRSVAGRGGLGKPPATSAWSPGLSYESPEHRASTARAPEGLSVLSLGTYSQEGATKIKRSGWTAHTSSEADLS